jgi:hypothetical protein
MWQLLYNCCKCVIKTTTMLQLMYNVHTCDYVTCPHCHHLLWDPSYFQTSQFSYFLFILSNLKCYRNTTWSSTNHIWSIMAIKQYTKIIIGCLETNLCSISVVCFLKFLTPSSLGGYNLLNSMCFLQFLMC